MEELTEKSEISFNYQNCSTPFSKREIKRLGSIYKVGGIYYKLTHVGFMFLIKGLLLQKDLQFLDRRNFKLFFHSTLGIRFTVYQENTISFLFPDGFICSEDLLVDRIFDLFNNSDECSEDVTISRYNYKFSNKLKK